VSLIIITVTVAMRQNQKFDAPYPDIKASKDSAIIARGKFFVYGPAHCAYCHTKLDKWEEVEQGKELPLSGAHLFDFPPGKLYSANLTPDSTTGIGRFSDGEIARALRFGVGQDGHAMFDLMPFHNVSDEDLTAIISYLRSMPPVKNEVPANEFNIMGNIVKAFLIKPVGPDIEVPKTSPKPDTTVEYGKYLAESVANCRGCHTERDLKTGAYTGPFYGGGLKVPSEIDQTVMLCTPNITTDPTYGRLGSWTQADFVARFRAGRKERASIMPWGPFSRMTDTDLIAIYKFLKTVPPLANNPGPALSAVEY
jgi:mono/diheme cytochrome c family protein